MAIVLGTLNDPYFSLLKPYPVYNPEIKVDIDKDRRNFKYIVHSLAILTLTGLVLALTGIFVSHSLCIAGITLISPLIAGGISLLVCKKLRLLVTNRKKVIQGLMTKTFTEILKEYPTFLIVGCGLLASVKTHKYSWGLTNAFKMYYLSLEKCKKLFNQDLDNIERLFKKRNALQAELPAKKHAIECANKTFNKVSRFYDETYVELRTLE